MCAGYNLPSSYNRRKSKHWWSFAVSEPAYCRYIGFGNIIGSMADRNPARNMSVPLAVSSVGTIILSLSRLELSYERPVIIFANRPPGCLKEWKDQLRSNSVWNFCLFVHAKDKSPQKDGMKRKFKVCRDHKVLKCAINQKTVSTIRE